MTPLTDAEHATLVHLRREYSSGVKRKKGWTLSAMAQEYELFRSLAERRWECLNGRRERPEDERILTEFYWFVHDEEEKILNMVRDDCPIAWFEPSWEQAQMLNCWHPEFDPEVPGGHRTCLAFGGIQTGKTLCQIINALLWLGPNNAEWPLFSPRTDPYGRGEYRVFPRFLWDEWKRSGRIVYDDQQPPKHECTVWQGCVDEQHWTTKIEPPYKKWIPQSWIGRRGKDKTWWSSEKRFETKWGGTLIGKLYNSEMQAWGGKRVHLINGDEGMEMDKLDEIVVRCSYFMWGYSPREAANMGSKIMVAKSAHDGKIKLPGYPDVPPYKVMARLESTPDRIMPEEDRRTRIAIAESMGEKGKPVLGLGFFTSSPLVFNTFDRRRHVLPWSAAEIVAAIDGRGTPELVKIFEKANILRGFDEGVAAPSACVWLALLKTGEMVAFRDWEEAGLSISDASRTIVEMSGNRLEEVKMAHVMTTEQMERMAELGSAMIMDRKREEHTGAKIRRLREVPVREDVRKTVADSKMFKRDPNFLMDSWVQNYSRAGLKLERARSLGPAERCFYVKDMFIADPTRRHLNPRQLGESSTDLSGHRLYIGVDCQKLIERMENYLQAVFLTGPRKGDYTGKPAEGDDHVVDALCYPCVAQFRWINPAELHARRGDRKAA